jgi:LuxR family maltose regulon positive regulatory protein
MNTDGFKVENRLLKTKLYIPPPSPRLVDRPRLVLRLNEGLEQGHKLTLVSASVGYGKTTLVSSWLFTTSRPFAWLSLDAGDNDPARFWRYCIAALQTVQPALGQAELALLQTARTPPIENLVTDLINQMTTLPEEIVLAIDDYHLIEAIEIHQGLGFLLGHMPSPLHLVLITREDPPLPLSQLRAGGQMTELRAADLRFTPAETAEFFDKMARDLNLGAEDIAVLGRRTEGWVAGLQLAALSLSSAADKAAFIEDFAGDDRYVVEYLISEVMDCQPAHIQDFMLKTASLDRFTAALCDAVTGQENGRDALAYLQRANLFTVPLDNKGEWYRYHHLFATLLRYQLREAAGVKGIQQLHQRAATWHAQNGFTDEAIHYALEARDFGLAADLMETVSVDGIVRGQQRQVRDWLEALPEAFLRTRALLCACHALALNLSGQAANVVSRLQDAERALPTAPTAQRRDIQGLIDFVRAYLARRQNDMPLSTQYLRQAAEGLSEENLAVRGAVYLNLGFNYALVGQLAQADRTLQAARRDGQAVGAVYTTLIAMAVQANTYAAQGKLHQATRLYEETIEYGLNCTGGRPFPPAGYAYAGLGQVVYQQNDMEKAEQLLHQAVELGESIGDWSMIRRGLLSLAWLKQMQGDRTTAQAFWQRALDVVQQAESQRVEAHLRVHQARLWLAQATASAHTSALALAQAWADDYQRGTPDPASYPQALAQRTLAWLRVVQGQADRALAGLEPVAQAATAGGQIDHLIDLLALQGLARSALGETEAALDSLNRAFVLAAPEGYVRTFVDYGPPMQQLLQQALKAGLFAEYVPTLLASLPGPSSPSPLFEPLTDRELSILRLMAAGLSHAEIASELYLSVNTIRWYTTRIYGKLGVHRRAHAVARAQELGIL